jgi:hypothetical protein
MKKTNIVLETVPNTSMNEITSYKAAFPYKINEEYWKNIWILTIDRA